MCRQRRSDERRPRRSTSNTLPVPSQMASAPIVSHEGTFLPRLMLRAFIHSLSHAFASAGGSLHDLSNETCFCEEEILPRWQACAVSSTFGFTNLSWNLRCAQPFILRAALRWQPNGTIASPFAADCTVAHTVASHDPRSTDTFAHGIKVPGLTSSQLVQYLSACGVQVP